MIKFIIPLFACFILTTSVTNANFSGTDKVEQTKPRKAPKSKKFKKKQPVKSKMSGNHKDPAYK